LCEPRFAISRPFKVGHSLPYVRRKSHFAGDVGTFTFVQPTEKKSGQIR
jgi:hypothetical protein